MKTTNINWILVPVWWRRLLPPKRKCRNCTGALLIMILICLNVACGKQQPATDGPVTPANQNLILEPSAATCAKIKANLTGDFFVDLAPEVLSIMGGHPSVIDQIGDITPVPDGNLPLGTYCVLVVASGKVTGVM